MSRFIVRCWRDCSGTSDRRATRGMNITAHAASDFAIFPGSALRKSAPKWVVAAELVETTRLYARCVARIAPEWIEPLAVHLVQRHYFDPHWSKSRGMVMVYERVTSPRPDDRAQTPGSLRPDQSARSARDLHSQSARRRRVRYARRLLRTQPAARTRAAGARTQGAAQRRAGGRRDDLSILRRACARSCLQRGRFRSLAPRSRSGRSTTCCISRANTSCAMQLPRSPKRSFPIRSRRPGRSSDCVIGSSPAPARRRHCDGPAASSEQARRNALRLARAGTSARESHVVHQSAAEEHPPASSSRCRIR